MEKINSVNSKLAVCITFFYKKERVKYLLEVLDNLSDFSFPVDLTIVSHNLPEEFKLVLDNYNLNKNQLTIVVFAPHGLGHPLLLAWSHYYVFKEKILDVSYTHFLYLEDDIKFTEKNFNYWVQKREQFSYENLYPAFFRYEVNAENVLFSTDVLSSLSLYDCKIIKSDLGECFINIPFSYQAMYLYDRGLMNELFNSTDFSPDFEHTVSNSIIQAAPFKIREKAALGLTYINVPSGFWTRTILPYDFNLNRLSEECFIHHIPNNYVLDFKSEIGNVNLNSIFLKRNIFLFAKWILKRFVKWNYKLFFRSRQQFGDS